jgi:hypothetical protein
MTAKVTANGPGKHAWRAPQDWGARHAACTAAI